jgi:segregation and condensation protein B
MCNTRPPAHLLTDAPPMDQPTLIDTPPAPGLPLLVESLLFVAGEPVTVAQLAQALAVVPDAVEAALEHLAAASGERGFRVQRLGDRVQLVSAPEAAAVIERFLGLEATTRLSNAALETLAIIAYRQPVTRAQIEAVRGVDSGGVVRALLARGLIAEAGRLETVGRPFLYATTEAFLRLFGLTSLHDLPPVEIPTASDRAAT